MGSDNYVLLNGDEYGTLLRSGLVQHVNTKSLKLIAKEIGYPMSFFKPHKKTILLEELTFSHIAVVIHAVNLHKDTSESKIIIDSFLGKLRDMLNSFSVGEPDFQERYSSRLSSYFELFGNGGDLIGFSTQFLRFLHNGDMKLTTPKAMTFMANQFGFFLKELTQAFNNTRLKKE